MLEELTPRLLTVSAFLSLRLTASSPRTNGSGLQRLRTSILTGFTDWVVDSDFFLFLLLVRLILIFILIDYYILQSNHYDVPAGRTKVVVCERKRADVWERRNILGGVCTR